MINPPTDNLYKFCAILGLILIVFNSYYNFEMLSKTTQSLIILNGEEKKYGYELELHEEKAKQLSNELKLAIKFQDEYIQKLIATYKKKNLSEKQLKIVKFEMESDDKEYSKNKKHIESLHEITTKENQLLQFKEFEMETKYKLIDQETKKSEMYSNYLWAGTILGLILTVYGFINWIRIQRILDRNMENLQ